MSERREMWHLFHRLWCAMVGTNGYRKADWVAMEEHIQRLEADVDKTQTKMRNYWLVRWTTAGGVKMSQAYHSLGSATLAVQKFLGDGAREASLEPLEQPAPPADEGLSVTGGLLDNAGPAPTQVVVKSQAGVEEVMPQTCKPNTATSPTTKGTGNLIIIDDKTPIQTDHRIGQPCSPKEGPWEGSKAAFTCTGVYRSADGDIITAVMLGGTKLVDYACNWEFKPPQKYRKKGWCWRTKGLPDGSSVYEVVDGSGYDTKILFTTPYKVLAAAAAHMPEMFALVSELAGEWNKTINEMVYHDLKRQACHLRDITQEALGE